MKKIINFAIIAFALCFGCSNEADNRNPLLVTPNHSISGTYSTEESVYDSIRNLTFFKFGGADSFAVFQYGFSAAPTDSSLQLYSENHGKFRLSGDTIKYQCDLGFTKTTLKYMRLPINEAPFVKFIVGEIAINNVTETSFDFKLSGAGDWSHAHKDTLPGISL